VYAARTWQQLCQLTADLPVPADPSAERPAAPWTFAGADRCLLCVLLILCPPAGIAWWLLGRRRPAADPGRPGITFRGAPGGAVPPGREGEHAADR
jgi:hypothetical protein